MYIISQQITYLFELLPDEDRPLVDEELEELFLPDEVLLGEVDELEDEPPLPDDVRPTVDELLLPDEDELDDGLLLSYEELLCLPLMLEEDVVEPDDGLLLFDDDEPLLYLPPVSLPPLL